MSNMANVTERPYDPAPNLGYDTERGVTKRYIVPAIDGTCTCPVCNTRLRIGKEEGRMHTCNRCRYEWLARTDNPAKCPKCGSHAWHKIALTCNCKICGYEWISRKEGGPSRCPSCKSNRWDEVPKDVHKVVTSEETEEMNRKWIMSRYEDGQGCVEIATALGLPVFRVMTIVKKTMNSKYTPRI